jgi:hypothetical protein
MLLGMESWNLRGYKNDSMAGISRLARLLTLALLAAILCTTAHSGRTNFVPPRLVSAGDVLYPGTDAAAGGLLELAVDLDSHGSVIAVNTVRYIPSLTAAAVDAVMGWTFSPGFLDGNAVASTISVNFLFDPGTLPMKPVVLTPPDERWKAAERPSYIPPQTSAAWFAAYPSGGPPATVVLDALVTQAGEVSRTAAVYNVPSLTKDVVAATNHWAFLPATFRGDHVEGHTVAAFVYHAPLIDHWP